MFAVLKEGTVTDSLVVLFFVGLLERASQALDPSPSACGGGSHPQNLYRDIFIVEINENLYIW